MIVYGSSLAPANDHFTSGLHEIRTVIAVSFSHPFAATIPLSWRILANQSRELSVQMLFARQRREHEFNGPTSCQGEDCAGIMPIALIANI
jgi:hypothetical protein